MSDRKEYYVLNYGEISEEDRELDSSWARPMNEVRAQAEDMLSDADDDACIIVYKLVPVQKITRETKLKVTQIK
jgi:replicative DNA helicase